MYKKEYKKKIDVNPLNALPGLIMLVLFFVLLYYVATGIFKILAWASPVLLIVALIINHKVVLNYGKWLIRNLRTNPLTGILWIVLTALLYPIVCFFLFGKALLYRKVDKMQKEYETRRHGEFIEYEEVEEEESMKIELPPPPVREKRSDYDRLFDE